MHHISVHFGIPVTCVHRIIHKIVPLLPVSLFRSFKSARTAIERVFGILKCSYASVGTRRFRGRRYIAPLICNLTAALHNHRKKLFRILKNNLDN